MGDVGFDVRDENGTGRAQMSTDGIGYWDENGNQVWSTRCTPNC